MPLQAPRHQHPGGAALYIWPLLQVGCLTELPWVSSLLKSFWMGSRLLVYLAHISVSSSPIARYSSQEKASLSTTSTALAASSLPSAHAIGSYQAFHQPQHSQVCLRLIGSMMHPSKHKTFSRILCSSWSEAFEISIAGAPGLTKKPCRDGAHLGTPGG